jgi:hypothetical protein
VLAGMSAFWGGLLLAMVGGPPNTFIAPLSALVGVTCLAGSAALARSLPRAHRYLPRRGRRLCHRALPAERLTRVLPCARRER